LKISEIAHATVPFELIIKKRPFKNQKCFKLQGKRVFLVLSKKIDSKIIIEELIREGKFGRYELVRPAG
jgi:hypothetical protein